ncbi:MAG: hypothetical protein ACRDRH_17285 [Pseudonocardia sp.]
MSWWDSYRGVYGAELRAAAREFADHGWPVADCSPAGLLLATGTTLDVLAMPAELGRSVCAHLRDSDSMVPVAADPVGMWWFPVVADTGLQALLHDSPDVVLRSGGDVVLAPPSELPDGLVHWRVSPARIGWALPTADLIVPAVADVVRWRTDRRTRPGAQRPVAGLVAGMRS